MKSSRAMERLAQGLTIFTFVVLCWVVHRSLRERTECVNSSFISFVQIDGARIENCLYESRLDLGDLLHPLAPEKKVLLRSLEVAEPLSALFPAARPHLAVEVSLTEPKLFELGRGYLRLGEDWVRDRLQTERALIMGVLRREQPANYTSDFQLEVMTDFVLMSVMSEHEWRSHEVLDDIKFPTSAPSFADYCKSPFRSLAHYAACQDAKPDSLDMQTNVWGLRPLVAVALWRVFNHASLARKLRAMQALRQGELLPVVASWHDASLISMVNWFEGTVHEHLTALRFPRTADTEALVKRAMRELEVEAPTHWELTVDITQTPAWKEILQQFRVWTRYHKAERTLVFTPEGAVALPSGLPVRWTAGEIESQKHVLIACKWPKGEDVIAVSARHLFARQSCGKVEDVFWN